MRLAMSLEASIRRPLRFLAVVLIVWPAVSAGQGTGRPDADPRVEKLVASISVKRMIGVAAVGADGHESLVSAYVVPPPRFPDLQLLQ